jgi:hypothetical protein
MNRRLVRDIDEYYERRMQRRCKTFILLDDPRAEGDALNWSVMMRVLQLELHFLSRSGPGCMGT